MVLTGRGKDGAAGARAVRQAGGTVLAQSLETADEASMPQSAIDIGAVDQIVPLKDIGATIVNLLNGGSLPQPRDEMYAIRAVFGDQGAVAALAREIVRNFADKRYSNNPPYP